LEAVWEKPVLVFYKERLEEPETKAFAVIKAKRITISRGAEGGEFSGKIEDFFPLMGDVDYISSEDGRVDRYVLCWLDDEVDDFSKAWRRLNGVTFPAGATFVTDDKGKKTYNTLFKAEHGKLK